MNSTPKQIGPYEIFEECGRGGMSTVYRAYDTVHQREVALKVLLPQLTRDRIAIRRFEQEGQSTQRLVHPHIVRIYAADQADGLYYIAMVYVKGMTLADRLKRQRAPLTLEESVPILEQVATALDYAHGQGVLHRDIKPSNVLLANDGEVLLSDFGAARLLNDDHTLFTTTGFTVGTPYYMSPEQARGDRQLDRRADVYSLGVIAYLMLTGHLPFMADDPLVLLRKIIDEPAPPPESFNPALPTNVAYIVRRALAKDPTRRYSTAGAFVADLARCLTGTGDKSSVAAPAAAVTSPAKRVAAQSRLRPHTPIAVVLVVAVVIIVGGFWWLLAPSNFSQPLDTNQTANQATATVGVVAAAIQPTMPAKLVITATATSALVATQVMSSTFQATLAIQMVTATALAPTLLPTATLIAEIIATVSTHTPTGTPTTSVQTLASANNRVASSKPPTSTPIPDNTDTPTPTTMPTPVPPTATPVRVAVTLTTARAPTASNPEPTSKGSAAEQTCPSGGCSVTLMAPPEGSSSSGKQEFRWQANFNAMPGQAFEVVFWKPDQDPMIDGKGFGGTSNLGAVNIDSSQQPPGEYLWGVLLVQTTPNYERLAYLGGARRFIIQAVSKDNRGSDGGNGNSPIPHTK